MNEIENMLEEYVISYHLLPYLDYDPEFQRIMDSDAITQLFSINRSKEYLKKYNIKRYNYSVSEKIRSDFEDAVKHRDEKLFNYNPNLINYKNFPIYFCNFPIYFCNFPIYFC